MEKSEDQKKREIIPTRDSLKTQYHPLSQLLMVVPIPGITKVGNIILPEKSTIQMNEGHIVEKGPKCTENVQVGDCVTWDQNSEYRLDVDGVKFVLVNESSCTMRIPLAELQTTDPNQTELPLP